MKTSEIAKLFEKAYQAKTQNNYWNQIFELRKFANEEMISECFLLIDSDDLKSKQIGIDILSQLGRNRKSFLQKLFTTIFEVFENSTNEKLICASLIAVGHNNKFLKAKHLKILQKFVHSKSKDIRYALTFSLFGIENKTAIDLLIKLAQDKSLKIKDWATFGLGTKIKTDHQEIRNILYKNASSKDDQIRQEAIKGLSNRRDPKVHELILNEFKKENFGSYLFDTILDIKDGQQYIPILVDIYKKQKVDNTINEEWLADLKNCIKVLEED